MQKITAKEQENDVFLFAHNLNFRRLSRVKKRLQLTLFDLMRHFIHSDVSDKKYNVAVCAIFKDEASYLKEWLEYHKIIGVQHFYLYNNNSTDNFMEIIKPYLNSGEVDLINWPENQAQMKCYKECIKSFSRETKWIGFIDLDEFIVPKKYDDIYDFLKGFEKRYGSVLLYWKIFGTSGYLERDTNDLIIEDFTVSWPKYIDTGKCFYNTAFVFDDDVKKSSSLHHMLWTKFANIEFPPVNAFGRSCIDKYHPVPHSDFPVQINHYFTKSYREYQLKNSRGDVFYKTPPYDEQYFLWHEMKATSVDYSAYKYLIKLKLKMQEVD